MSGTPTVVVVGDLVTDVIVRATADIASHSDTQARIAIAGGGAGANVAAWLAHLGVEVGLIARIGDDAAGRAAVAELDASGVAVAAMVDAQRSTGTVVALIDDSGDRTMLTDRGASAHLEPHDLPATWFRGGAHLHLSGYLLFAEPGRATAVTAMRRAQSAGMTISVDPASRAPLEALGADTFRELTAAANLTLPNRDEALVLTGAMDPADAARQLGAGYGEAVVTCGADGAVWSDGSSVVRQAGRSTHIVDTAGAGDAFAAGFLECRLRGAPPADALIAAGRLATRSAQKAGARP